MGSPPNRRIQNAWLRTATGLAPGLTSSWLVKSRPVAGPTPSLSNASPDTYLRSHSFLFASTVCERYGPYDLCAHREEVDLLARGVAKTHEHRVGKGVALGPFGAVRGIREVNQLLRVKHWQRPEDQRVNQRERRNARAEGQRQRYDGGASDHSVLSQHACAEADVARQRIEPGEELHVEALFAQPQRAAEPLCRLPDRGFARHPSIGQLADARVEVELELLVELVLDAPGPKDVEET